MYVCVYGNKCDPLRERFSSNVLMKWETNFEETFRDNKIEWYSKDLELDFYCFNMQKGWEIYKALGFFNILEMELCFNWQWTHTLFTPCSV